MLQRTLWVLALTLVGCTSAQTAGGGALTAPAPTAPPPTAPAATRPAPAEPGLLAPETVVDEYKVAGPIECPFDPSRPHDYEVTEAYIEATNARCDEVVQIARDAVIKRHALDSKTIGIFRVYVPYVKPGHALSGPDHIVVFDLADGTQVAARVACAIGPCQYSKPSPLDAPEPVDHSGTEGETPPTP